jgi:hypothetical protein
MKYFFPSMFIFMGAVFLLVGTVFYPSITELMVGLQTQAGFTALEFWNLSLILGIVRVIFLIVGSFLMVLGIVFIGGKFWRVFG